MADFTYSGAPSPSNPLSMVRFILPDTVEASALFTDTEINAALALQPTVTYAAAALADILAGRFASEVDTAIGQTRISLSQKSEQWAKRAIALRKGGAGDLPGGDGTGVKNAEMFVGGISVSEAENLNTGDSDRIQPSFRIGQDDMNHDPRNDDNVEYGQD